MAEIKVLLFDIGGVLLSNGWDRHSRQSASDRFDLDWENFEDRHQFVANDFETGKLTLGQYLRRTVFYRERDFTEDEFFDFMKARSEPHADTLDLVREIAESRRYVLGTLNNESRELNDYRIHEFGLRQYFSVFLSSCYVGMRKPDADIYELAVDVVQYSPPACVFIDDRELNLECAVRSGIRSIHFEDANQLRTSLIEMGVTT